MEYVLYKGALTARVAVDHALRAVETLGPEKSTFDHSPSIFVYSALLDVCAKAGAEEEAVSIMRRMKSENVQQNVVSYSAYLSIFATAGARGDRRAPYKALEALEEMRAVGLAPNEFSYSSAIASCASATTSIGCSAAVDLGRMLLAAMLRDGLEVTAVPYNTLLAGCARAMERDAAGMDLCWQLFSEMQERSIPMTVVTYTTLIDAGARAGDERILERGMQLLQQMADQGLAPNVVTFNAMFKAHILKSTLQRDVTW
jgi:pentatricopeptide repeat domain-containing protein 1